MRWRSAGARRPTSASSSARAPRASEILKRKRPLTLAMAHKLHAEWHIPADVLIRPYHLDEEARRPA
jgi:HTH-type transcriptional regulator/antitoxin HigA